MQSAPPRALLPRARRRPPHAPHSALPLQTLSIADDAVWDDLYRNASSPAPNQLFPLQGAVVGCLVGRAAVGRGAPFSAGAWNGKVFRGSGADGTPLTNLLVPLPPGGAFSAVDSFNWSSFLPVMEQFNGRLSYGPSWFDVYQSVTSRRSQAVGSAWIITYDEVAPGGSGSGGTGAAGLLGALLPQGAGNALGAVVGLYANLVASSRDEMRLISPGAVLGQVFFRPRSPSNPLPLPVASGIRFALFQVCAKGGGYAYGGNQRYLGPALPAAAPAAG